MNSEYQAFLLRLHRSQGQMHWRVTMENAHTGEVLHFATERELLRYLLEVLQVKPTGFNKSEDTNHSDLNL